MTGPRVDVNCCSTLHPEAVPCNEVTHVGNLEIGKVPRSAHRFANAALNWLAAIDAVTGF